jgi:glycosyltransferase involved in cell wall biosynthesis
MYLKGLAPAQAAERQPGSSSVALDRRPASGSIICHPGWWWGRTHAQSLSDCCLIIPTFKRPADLSALLRHLVGLEQKMPGSVPGEIVIVDGSPDTASEAATALVLQDCPFILKYLRTAAGLTRQRNVGIDASSAELVFFLDDDAMPELGYFRTVREVFVADTIKSIGAVGGCITNEWNRPLILRWRIRFLLGIVPRIDPMRYSHCGTSNPRSMLKPFRGIREVDLLPGCAFSFRRQVFESDRFSNFFDGYSQGEDMEMSLRVRRRWKVVCAGDAKVEHRESRSGRPASFAKGRMEVRNRVFIWRRYSKALATFLDKSRLLTDFGFLVLVDLAGFLRRPWKPTSLLHGAGIVYGAMECAFDPPQFEEPIQGETHHFNFRAVVRSSDLFPSNSNAGSNKS